MRGAIGLRELLERASRMRFSNSVTPFAAAPACAAGASRLAARRRWGSGLCFVAQEGGSSLRLVEAFKPRDVALHFANKNSADEIFRRKHSRLRAEFPKRPRHLDLNRAAIWHAPVGADAGLPGGVGLHTGKVEISLHPHGAVPASERSAADFQHSVADRDGDLQMAEFEVGRLQRLEHLFLDRVFREGHLHCQQLIRAFLHGRRRELRKLSVRECDRAPSLKHRKGCRAGSTPARKPEARAMPFPATMAGVPLLGRADKSALEREIAWLPR